MPSSGVMPTYTNLPKNIDCQAGLLAGGCDEGEPGQRSHYGDGYYGAYLRDPDGNKVHIAHRGDLYLAG